MPTFFFYAKIFMEVNSMRKNRKYSAEFKIQCIKEVVEEYKSHKMLSWANAPNLGLAIS